ncbi:sodium-independent sulfate anion transporter-like [Amphiura filiformis]|uniref:sodium-independent sulfate anion transporter-like n=1 Tax=Amphiura filiformis TaxID=82378 RepID=UPI003B20FD68
MSSTEHTELMSTESFKTKVKNGIKDYFSVDAWKDRFPITRWLPQYKASKGLSDVIAGLTVGLTVIPQGLAYASIAKLPLVYGLYSAFMGSFVYLFLGMSKDITVGPTAIMSLLVGQYGKPIDEYGEVHDPTYAILLAFFCGIFQILMGMTRLGFVTNYISAVVISAFTSVSAINIGFGQIKNLLGIRFQSETFVMDFYHLFKHIKETKWPDLVLGISSILFLALMRFGKNKSQVRLDKIGKAGPTRVKAPWKALWILGTARNAVLVVIAAGIMFIVEMNGSIGQITLTGNVTSGLPPFRPPNLGAENILKHLNIGLVIIPLIGFLENIAIAKGFARQNGYKVESNQELIALGACNLANSFVSAYPTTGSFSRSAINSQSGVRTPAGGVVTGAIVLLALQFLTPAFRYIPKASLAAVILYSVIFMVDYEIVSQLWKLKKIDLLPLCAVFFPSLVLGIEYGTIIGISVDILLLLYPIAKPGYHVEKNGFVILKLKRGIRFPAVDLIQTILDEKSLMTKNPTSVIVDFTHVSSIDFSVVEGIKDTCNSFKKRGLKVAFVNVLAKVRFVLDHGNIDNLFMYDSIEEAIQDLKEGNDGQQTDGYSKLDDNRKENSSKTGSLRKIKSASLKKDKEIEKEKLVADDIIDSSYTMDSSV